MSDEGTYGLHRSGRRSGRTEILRFGQSRHGAETLVEYHKGGQLLIPTYTGELPVVLYAGFTCFNSSDIKFITYEDTPSPSRYQGLHSRLGKGVYVSPSLKYATFVAGSPAFQNIGIALIDASKLETSRLVIDPEITIWATDLQDDLIGVSGARRHFPAKMWEPNPDNGLWSSASNRRIPVGYLYLGSVEISDVVDFRKAV